MSEKRRRHKWNPTLIGSVNVCTLCGMTRKGERFVGRYRDGYRFSYYVKSGAPAPTHYDRRGNEATPLCADPSR